MTVAQPLLSIDELSISFTQHDPGHVHVELPVIDRLQVRVQPGELVAIVGASGSGKTLLAEAILGLYAKNANVHGSIRFDGRPVDTAGLRKLRGREIALVPQSVNSLDPLMKVGEQVIGVTTDRAKSLARMRELFARYRLDDEVAQKYPFELSGGMARRVILVAALMAEPKLLVADEPTPGMHLELAQQAMQDFRDYADQGNGVLLITHDLELAISVSDRIAVFYAGTTVETALASDFGEISRLRHPYTRALARALPSGDFEPLAGAQPLGRDRPAGCLFGPRCEFFDDRCSGEIPTVPVRGGMVRCINPDAYRTDAP